MNGVQQEAVHFYIVTSSDFALIFNVPPVFRNIFCNLMIYVDFRAGVLTLVVMILPSNTYSRRYGCNCSIVFEICCTAFSKSDPFSSIKNALLSSLIKKRKSHFIPSVRIQPSTRYSATFFSFVVYKFYPPTVFFNCYQTSVIVVFQASFPCLNRHL